MALGKCSECGEAINDRAAICAHCGAPTGGSTAAAQGREWCSSVVIGGLPLVHIATGIDPLTGRRRIAKGVIAIGDVAIGVVALGVFAFGGISAGAVAVGLVVLGGVAVAALFGLGGLAVGYVAVGGLAIGVWAYGGQALGAHAFHVGTVRPSYWHWRGSAGK